MGYKWDKDTVVEHMSKRLSRNKSLKAIDVRKDSPTLYYAAKYYFGSYKAALDAMDGYASAESPRTEKPVRMDKDELLQTLRDAYSAGSDISHAAVKDMPIYRDAKRLFGSWRAAIEAAGINYVEVRRYGWGAARALKTRQKT